MTAELKVLEAEPLGEGINEALALAVEMASKGDLSSIAIAYVMRDGSTGSINSSSPSTGLLIGAVALLQHKLIDGLLY